MDSPPDLVSISATIGYIKSFLSVQIILAFKPLLVITFLEGFARYSSKLNCFIIFCVCDYHFTRAHVVAQYGSLTMSMHSSRHCCLPSIACLQSWL